MTRRSTEGRWHAVNKDPGLTPYLVLNCDSHHDSAFLPFTSEQG
ncbi:hypothetical protein [Streptomyces sp. NPDC051921]